VVVESIFGPRKRGPTVARATEPNGEVTSVALPNNADVAGGIHCDLRDGVESRDNRLGEVYWRGESITPIVRAAEEHIRGSKKSGLSCQTTLMVPPESTAMRGLKEKPALLETPLWGRKRSAIRRTAEQDIRVRVGIIFPHHVDVPTQIQRTSCGVNENPSCLKHSLAWKTVANWRVRIALLNRGSQLRQCDPNSCGEPWQTSL